MQYMALIYTDPAREPVHATEGGRQMLDAYRGFNETAGKAGVLKGGEALQPPSTATCVRVRGGKTETMDGPFAETKEQLGGFYLLDCKDLDEALHFAAMIPGAQHGTVEVRPVVVWG